MTTKAEILNLLEEATTTYSEMLEKRRIVREKLFEAYALFQGLNPPTPVEGNLEVQPLDKESEEDTLSVSD